MCGSIRCKEWIENVWMKTGGVVGSARYGVKCGIDGSYKCPQKFLFYQRSLFLSMTFMSNNFNSKKLFILRLSHQLLIVSRQQPYSNT